MTTKSLHLLLLVLPLACSTSQRSNTAPTATDVSAAGFSIRPRVMRPVLVGGVKQFVADAPGGSVTWRSSSPEVAVVSASGLVRGISRGSATVSAIATYPNGTTRTASVGITVSPQAPVDSIATRRHRRY